MLMFDLGRVVEFALGGEPARIVGGFLLTAAAFAVAYGAPEFRRRRRLRALRPPRVHAEKPQ
jgi:hypothetical protein